MIDIQMCMLSHTRQLSTLNSFYIAPPRDYDTSNISVSCMLLYVNTFIFQIEIEEFKRPIITELEELRKEKVDLEKVSMVLTFKLLNLMHVSFSDST